MGIDPAGRGADETGYAVVSALNGMLYLRDAGAVKGYHDESLEKLANIAKKYAVNHVVYEPNFGDGMFGVLLARVFQRVYDTRIVHRNGDGGRNMGASVFTNLKLDGADERTILYQASNVGYPAKAVFIYPHFSAGQLDNTHLEGNARVQLKAGHFVQVIGGENFCNENGYGVEFDGGGTFLGQGIIMESAYMKGAGTADGYRLIGCVEDTGAAGHRILEFVPDVP
jgi:hypothetical protein